MLSRILIAAACASLVLAAERLEDTIYVPYEHKAIQYFETVANEPVKHLDEAIDAGKANLQFEPGGFSYLRDLLKHLDINPDSQTLVFAQDSFQASVISPEWPRAIYFNDEVAVGFEPNGQYFEVSALDPRQGVMFYTLEKERQAKASFGRRETCLQCHQGGQTLGIPGLVVSSQYIPKGADVEHVRGGYVTDDRTPIEDRWGGWFISGSVPQKNRGVPVAAGSQLSFDPSRYLSPISDVVALLTLEHQTRMTDLIVRIGWDTRIAMADGKLAEAQPKLDAAIDDMVGYMLFADEAPLTGPIKGASTFSRTFPERGPRDPQGRSLRDFDLEKRLFKYPCSYMIYTKAFDSLPQWDLDRIYRRLYDVLSGKNTDAKFAKLSADDRRNVLAILRATKPNLPNYWR